MSNIFCTLMARTLSAEIMIQHEVSDCSYDVKKTDIKSPKEL